MKRPTSLQILFSILVISLYVLETALSVDFSQSWVIILLQLDLFAVLIGWHLGLGVLMPWLRKRVWQGEPEPDDLRYDQPDNELTKGYLSYLVRLGIPVLLTGEVLVLVGLLNQPDLSVYFILAAYILGPSLLLLYRNWVLTAVAILWTWFPIEWGVVDDALGQLSMTFIPLDALLGIFALVWPLLVHGRHISWYDWSISRDDLMVVGKVSGFLTLTIVPLGILTNFITINPDNFLHPDVNLIDNPILNSIIYIFLIFYLIFMVQGLMEETLFRDLIFKHHYYWLQDRERPQLDRLMIILAGVLVASIPFWDDMLSFLADLIPFLRPVADTVGNMALPLGQYEGKSIAAIEGISLWLFYLLIAILLVIISLIIYYRDPSSLMAALLVSSIIFGFAHFQDFRYVFFASVAGFGYGYTYYRTKNLVPAAMVHMGVDAIWVLLLTY